jgi:hypothetical protein
VQWARRPELNHFRPPEDVRELFAETGFEELTWIDEIAPALRWYQERIAAMPDKPPRLGLHRVLGNDFGEMFRNQVRNLQERGISLAQAVFERP